VNDPVVRRYENNPILTRADVPYPVATVHNAAAVLFAIFLVWYWRRGTGSGRPAEIGE